MANLKPLAIVIPVLALLGFGAWLLAPRSSDSAAAPSAEIVSGPTRDSSDLGAQAAGTRLDPGPEDLDAGERAPAEAEPSAAVIARGSREQQAEFEKKYSGKTRLELEVALGALTPVRRDLQKSLMQTRRDAGLFTRIYPSGNQPLNLTELGKSEADRAIPNPMGFHAGSVRGGDEDGKSYVELVTLPHGAYPEFDALQAEELWLNDRIQTLK